MEIGGAHLLRWDVSLLGFAPMFSFAAFLLIAFKGD
jgi:hypothetical protein